MLFGNLARYPESQTCAQVQLGSEERLENVRQIFGADPGSVIGDLHLYDLFLLRRTYANDTAGATGIHGVHHHVREELA